jgi:hypothetical protein
VRQGLFFVFKHAQGVIFGGHVEEALIFQGKLKKKVARSDGKQKSKEKNNRRECADGPKRWYQKKSANAKAYQGHRNASQLREQMLTPGVANLVGKQNAQSLWGTDQIAEGVFLTTQVQLAAQHIIWNLSLD